MARSLTCYTQGMPDMSGHDAPGRDELHTMTLTELEARVAAAGVLISRRQLMRHCEAGTFDAKRLPAVNNLEQWFIAPGSVDKGIADIKTLQEQRARRDATRHDMADQDRPGKSISDEQDTTGRDATQPVTSDAKNKGQTPPDTSRHVGTDRDIFEHPYVKKLEAQVEKWEGKFHDQVRRTEDIQLKGAQQLLELQRMTAVGQSETLADFMLKAKDWILGPGAAPENREVRDATNS